MSSTDVPTLASLAGERFRRNCTAAGMALPFPEVTVEIARDGATHARRDGRWLAGCSVPRRAADVMLRNESWSARTLCLLVPTSGHQAAACLDKLGPTRALVVIVPGTDWVADAFACCDFADAIDAGRLHFAWDEASLMAIFERHSGMAVPQQMVRLPDADPDAVTATIKWVQPLLATHTARQTQCVVAAATAQTIVQPSAAPCLLVARHFRPFADAGDTLARLFDASELSADDVELFDTDQPLHSAEAAAAERAAAAGRVIADRPRPAWATWNRPWVAWITKPAMPTFDPRFPNDRLLLADHAWVALAKTAGWPPKQLSVARWPVENLTVTRGAPLALIADRPDLEPPADVTDSSARQLVWEAIRDELTRDPFALGDDAVRYVERAPGRLKLPPMADFPSRSSSTNSSARRSCSAWRRGWPAKRSGSPCTAATGRKSRR